MHSRVSSKAERSVTLLFAQQTSCVMYRTRALLRISLFQTLAIVNTCYDIQQTLNAFLVRGKVSNKWVPYQRGA